MPSRNFQAFRSVLLVQSEFRYLDQTHHNLVSSFLSPWIVGRLWGGVRMLFTFGRVFGKRGLLLFLMLWYCDIVCNFPFDAVFNIIGLAIGKLCSWVYRLTLLKVRNFGTKVFWVQKQDFSHPNLNWQAWPTHLLKQLIDICCRSGHLKRRSTFPHICSGSGFDQLCEWLAGLSLVMGLS